MLISMKSFTMLKMEYLFWKIFDYSIDWLLEDNVLIINFCFSWFSICKYFLKSNQRIKKLVHFSFFVMCLFKLFSCFSSKSNIFCFTIRQYLIISLWVGSSNKYSEWIFNCLPFEQCSNYQYIDFSHFFIQILS